MQKLYPWVIACILSLAGDAGYAQEKPHPLGRSTEVLQSFRQQMQLSKQQRRINYLVLRTSARDSLSGKVNFRQSEGGGYEYLIGEIDSIPGSSFMIRIQGSEVQGHIILRNSKKAWTWYSDANGDVYIKETDINKVLCIEYDKAPASASTGRAAAITPAALAGLQSYPEGNGCVLLDFDGQFVSGTPWNNGNPIDAAPANLNDSVKYEVWQMMSEDFRPFRLNITTSEAVYLSYPANRRMRCIFTPTNTAAPGAGGVAYLNSFIWGNETPCWVFNTGVKGAGEAGSHEVGHTFGLGHDGRTNPVEEYYRGQGDWAPIMGVGYYEPITQWSKGEYANPSRTEDDLNILTSNANGIGYRADDYGGTTATASPLWIDSTGAVATQGIIDRTSDVDMLSFTTAGGTINLIINPADKHPNLDILAVLYNSAGGVLAASDPTGLSASINIALPAGTYFLSVAGAGSGSPVATGYSNYGSLGAYLVTGTIPGTTSNTVANFYQDCNYTGAFAISLPPGYYTTADLEARGIADNQISSFTVNSGYEVILYKNDYLTGSFTSFTSNSPCLDSIGWNDSTSSLRIRAVTNQLPVVSFVKPASGSSFLAPATIVISVNASDADGSIGKVEFFSSDVKIGEATSAPYTFTWSNVPVGSFTIRAIATDDRGGQSLAERAVTVSNTPAAIVYKDCNFSGTSIPLAPGYYTLADLQSLGVQNDDISSLRVSSGLTVELWEHDNFAGTSVSITADNACLVANSFNDRASSLRIFRRVILIPAATVFKDCQFGGTAIRLGTGDYTLSELQSLGMTDNDVSSIKIANNYQLQLYTEDNWTGTSQVYNADNACLVSTGFNDVATSLRIIQIRPPARSAVASGADAGGLQLMPKPVHNEVRLVSKENLTGAVIQVYDVMGRKVLSAINTNNRLQVSHLPPGVYSLTIISKGKLITSRFIK
jgi:hypothetical protein